MTSPFHEVRIFPSRVGRTRWLRMVRSFWTALVANALRSLSECPGCKTKRLFPLKLPARAAPKALTTAENSSGESEFSSSPQLQT